MGNYSPVKEIPTPKRYTWHGIRIDNLVQLVLEYRTSNISRLITSTVRSGQREKKLVLSKQLRTHTVRIFIGELAQRQCNNN